MQKKSRGNRPGVRFGHLRIFLAAFLAVVPSSAAFAQGAESSVISAKQGSAIELTFRVPDQKVPPKVEFKGKPVPVYPVEPDGSFGVLLGVDLNETPSKYDLTVHVQGGIQKHTIEVTSVNFGVEELTLPKEKVTLDTETLKRVRKEQEEILAAMKPVTDTKYWEGPFLHPVEGTISGRFGVKRILNGEPRSPHTGEDFKAPEGTPVEAANSGKVVLIGNYFFTGNSIIVDHGLGCYSMYFHLQEVLVGVDEMVKKGDVIGKVGATGRATGPHLHWGIRLNGARVNPLTMVELEPEAIF